MPHLTGLFILIVGDFTERFQMADTGTVRVPLAGLWGTVPELLFENKGLTPALQQLLTSYPNPTG